MMSPTKKQYSVAIIGAGQIGCGYDSPDSKEILSHAHAFTVNQRTKLAGIVDVAHERGELEAKRWESSFYPTIESLAATLKPDIIVIATPDTTHADMLERVLAIRPKLIVCEKPLASKQADADLIARALSGTDTPVIVNFTRRYDTTMVHLRERFAEALVTSAHARYGKGTHHMGSHLFDLLRYFFGEMTGAAAQTSIDDYPGDPTFGGTASFERCPEVRIEVVDSRVASVFELDIKEGNGHVRIKDLGFTLETEVNGTLRRERTELSEALAVFTQHCVFVLEGREELRTPASDALKTFNACERFADSYRRL